MKRVDMIYITLLFLSFPDLQSLYLSSLAPVQTQRGFWDE